MALLDSSSISLNASALEKTVHSPAQKDDPPNVHLTRRPLGWSPASNSEGGRRVSPAVNGFIVSQPLPAEFESLRRPQQPRM